MAPNSPVEQLDPETKQVMRTFASISEAARALNVVPSAINQGVNKGRISGGYFWRHVDPGRPLKRKQGVTRRMVGRPVMKKPARWEKEGPPMDMYEDDEMMEEPEEEEEVRQVARRRVGRPVGVMKKPARWGKEEPRMEDLYDDELEEPEEEVPRRRISRPVPMMKKPARWGKKEVSRELYEDELEDPEEEEEDVRSVPRRRVSRPMMKKPARWEKEEPPMEELYEEEEEEEEMEEEPEEEEQVYEGDDMEEMEEEGEEEEEEEEVPEDAKRGGVSVMVQKKPTMRRGPTRLPPVQPAPLPKRPTSRPVVSRRKIPVPEFDTEGGIEELP